MQAGARQTSREIVPKAGWQTGRKAKIYGLLENAHQQVGRKITGREKDENGSKSVKEKAVILNIARRGTPPANAYVLLKNLQLQNAQLISLAALESAWGLEEFLPWYKRRDYYRHQQRAFIMKHEVHIPKPAALGHVPTTPEKRAAVKPGDGPTKGTSAKSGAPGKKNGIAPAIKNAVTKAKVYVPFGRRFAMMPHGPGMCFAYRRKSDDPNL